MDQSKLPKHASKYIIVNSEINSLGTLYATFPSLLHARLTDYSSGDKQV